MTNTAQQKHTTYFIGSDFRSFFEGRKDEDNYTRGLCVESTVSLDLIRHAEIPSIKVTSFSFDEKNHGVDLYVNQFINDDHCDVKEEADGNFSLHWIGPVACAVKADVTWDGYERCVPPLDSCITATDFLVVKDKSGLFRRCVYSNLPNSSRGTGANELLAFAPAAQALTLSEQWVTSLGERRRFVTVFSRLDI